MRNKRHLIETVRRNVARAGAEASLRGVLMVALALASAGGMAVGCVETAECDATVPCEAGEECYDFECRPTCETSDECPAPQTCEPCQQDDSEGTVDHCFEASEFVCVVLEEDG